MFYKSHFQIYHVVKKKSGNITVIQVDVEMKFLYVYILFKYRDCPTFNVLINRKNTK